MRLKFKDFKIVLKYKDNHPKYQNKDLDSLYQHARQNFLFVLNTSMFGNKYLELFTISTVKLDIGEYQVQLDKKENIYFIYIYTYRIRIFHLLFCFLGLVYVGRKWMRDLDFTTNHIPKSRKRRHIKKSSPLGC